MPDVSVCIVNWNTREHLAACLESLRAHAGELELEVIVVDNASSDGSAQMVAEAHPWVRLIALDQNTYYAAGNNIALREVTAPNVLLLNPDIVVEPGSVQHLVTFLEEHPRAGAVAPRLRQPDGSIQLTCRSFPDPDVVIYEALGLSRLFPRSRRFGRYRMSWWDYSDTRPVDQPMASALMIRKRALDEVGLFDERFPMFFNDVDLCKRLWDAGWQVWFTPDVEMKHEGGASTRQVRREMIRASHRGMLDYYSKHYRGKTCPVLYWTAVGLLKLGLWARLALAGLRRQT